MVRSMDKNRREGNQDRWSGLQFHFQTSTDVTEKMTRRKNKGGREAGMEIHGGKWFRLREQPVPRPRGGVTPRVLVGQGGQCGWRSWQGRDYEGLWSGRLWGSSLLTWAACHPSCVFPGPLFPHCTERHGGEKGAGEQRGSHRHPRKKSSESSGDGESGPALHAVRGWKWWLDCMGTAEEESSKEVSCFVCLFVCSFLPSSKTDLL